MRRSPLLALLFILLESIPQPKRLSSKEVTTLRGITPLWPKRSYKKRETWGGERSPAFWSVPVTDLLQQLQTTPQGLTSQEARQRLGRYGANLLKPKKRLDALTLLLAQFKSPIILILLFAAGLSLFLHDPTDALIILGIVLVSGLLGFWQERGAADAVEKLLAIVQIKAMILRDASPQEVGEFWVVSL